MDPINTNIAETLAKEMKAPVFMPSASAPAFGHMLIPPGWVAKDVDLECFLPTPRRKKATVTITDKDCYIDYIKRHGSLANCTIWCDANFIAGTLAFRSILNDNGEEEQQPNWRDHTASFTPEKSEEWKRWTGLNGKELEQVGFAVFLEDNLKDISAGEGFPAGGDILQMALNFEANESMRFKSATRLQSGGVRMEYVSDEDKGTIEAMQVFERFQIGIPVFRDDTSRYPVTARLRYRVRDGKVKFWYELIRSDLVMEAAARAMVKEIRETAGMPFFFGKSQ